MSQFISKPLTVEAVTFSELVAYGKANGANIVNGMPWSFSYNGHPITHENDGCYIISPTKGPHNFTPGDMLITEPTGAFYSMPSAAFQAAFDPAPAP